MNWSNIGGAFVTGSTLYYVTKPDGVLHSIAWSPDHATGSPSVVDSTRNWASHGLFLHLQPPIASHQPAVAHSVGVAYVDGRRGGTSP